MVETEQANEIAFRFIHYSPKVRCFHVAQITIIYVSCYVLMDSTTTPFLAIM